MKYITRIESLKASRTWSFIVIATIYLVATVLGMWTFLALDDMAVLLRLFIADFVATVFVCYFIYGGFNATFALQHVLAGGLLLGAIFMATDYTTSPITSKGKVVYALGCALITCVIRLFGSLPEGVSYSIIIMNILVPHIENMTTPLPFGAVKEKKKKEAAQ